MVSHFEAARQKFPQVFFRATGQVIYLAAPVALEVVVVVQMGLLVESLATRHLHRLNFTRLEKRVDSPVDRRLAYTCLPLLRQRNKVCNAQRTVRFHDNFMDDSALARLTLSDLDHGICRLIAERRHSAAIGNCRAGAPRQNWLALCLAVGRLR